MLILKQSTIVDLPIGPFLDETDGRTAESALTITQPDVRLKKNGGAWAQKNAAQTLSHEEAGWYEVSLDATDTNTLGHLVVAVHEAGALPVWREFLVVPANVYDALVGGSDNLEVDTVLWRGSQPGTLNSGLVQSDVQRIVNDTLPALLLDAWAPRVADAQGGTAGTITLNASDSATADYYKGAVVVMRTGTCAGQARQIVSYNGSTKVATVSPGWSGGTPPASGNQYVIWAAGRLNPLGGAGALTKTIGVTAGGNPLEGASVWVATDAAGANVVSGALTTSGSGIVTVLLDAGTYYVWVQKDGYAPIIAEEITVS